MSRPYQTLLASELIKLLEAKVAAHGDKQLFLRDADTGWRVEINADDIEHDGNSYFLGHEDYGRIGE